jgi:hypothetical protein
MTDVLNYIKSKYQQTGWPFLKLSELVGQFGEQNARQALNQLHAMKMIKKRRGGNGDIVEYLITDK